MLRPLLCVLLLLVSTSPALAQGEQGAVILMGESGIEPDLVADLGEVLVTALLQKSGNRFRFLGKEGVVAELMKRRTESGQVCIESNDCLRAYAAETDLKLMVYGKVGKAAYGYWLIITKIGLTGIPDEIRKMKVEGGVTKLIEDVEASADWLLGPDRTWLRVRANQDGAVLSLDGREIGAVTEEPVEVAPGKHAVLVRKKGFDDWSGEVDCSQGTLSEVEAELVAESGPEPDPTPPVTPPPPAKKVRTWQILGGVFSGLAGAGLGSAIYFTIALQDDVKRYDRRLETLCPDRVCAMTEQAFHSDAALRSIKKDGSDHALGATISWIGTGVTGAAALTFFLVDAFAKPAASGLKASEILPLRPLLVPGFTGLTLDLGF
ncbi:MAG: PEGA domain-containing protein [Deltaproteobacteria bacterium]|nr:PEGA domain-containing protein [Deltaproteobacteria bacterium]